MWFNDKIFEADTTEDQSGTPMEKVDFLLIKTLYPSQHFLGLK